MVADNPNTERNDQTRQQIFRAAARRAGQTQDSTQIILTSGIYYFDELTLAGSTIVALDGRVMIFCAGAVSLSGDCQINPGGNPKDLAIYSLFSDIIIQDQAEVTAELLAPQGRIELSGTSTLFGSAFADTLSISGTPSV